MSTIRIDKSVRDTAARMRQQTARQQKLCRLGIAVIFTILITIGLGTIAPKWSQASDIAITKDAPILNHWPAAWASNGLTRAPGDKIDGISCQSMEGAVEHIHQHLTFVVNGKIAYPPAAVGIDSTTQCFYWLHTHTPDGIIHLESPQKRSFMLGEFLDIWRFTKNVDKSLLMDTVAKQQPSQVWLNSRLYRGNPWTIPLTPKAQIIIEYGRPTTKPQPFVFPPKL